jgi:hypothetical protein
MCMMRRHLEPLEVLAGRNSSVSPRLAPVAATPSNTAVPYRNACVMTDTFASSSGTMRFWR